MTLESRLAEAFIAYLNLAKADLRRNKNKPPSQQPVQLLETRSMELRRLVYGLEVRPERRALVKISNPEQSSSIQSLSKS